MFPSALGMTQHREIIPRTGTIAQAYSWFRTLNPAGRDACSPSSLGIGAYGPQREHVRPKTKLATPASGWRSISERFTAPIVAHAGHRGISDMMRTQNKPPKIARRSQVIGAVADVVEIWMTLSPAFSGYWVMRQRQAFADPS